MISGGTKGMRMHSTERPNTHTERIYDLAIIGAGINGAGIAADAAGRGLNVFLCDQHDIAAHTSSASSKLIHGGLRYLEQYQFRLVRQSLAEREVLMHKAAFMIEPLRFILPYHNQRRPAWAIRLGLFVYDHLSQRQTLEASQTLSLKTSNPLRPHIKQAFSYFDCRVDDARLVLLNAKSAQQHGATIAPYTRCVSAKRSKGMWLLQLQRQDGSQFSLRSRALVNACGPWVTEYLRSALKQPQPAPIRLVQGSHLVVKKIYEGEHAYVLQHQDGRIVFVIPYLEDFSLIGTTDHDFVGDPATCHITAVERDYLLCIVNEYLSTSLTSADIVHSFAGVRALWADTHQTAANVTRDYHLLLEGQPNEAPLLSVYGGKLTTYRLLAEKALALLAPNLPKMGPAWTQRSPLPGGESGLNASELCEALCRAHPWLPHALAMRWSRSYGSNAYQVLGQAQSVTDLGQHFGAGLYAQEVNYLYQHEWAYDTEAIVWRRSKLGLRLSPEQQQQLSDYLTSLSPAGLF